MIRALSKLVRPQRRNIAHTLAFFSAVFFLYPARNGPVRTRSIVLRNPASRASLSHRTEPDPGLLAITSEEVLASANKLLETSRLENSRG